MIETENRKILILGTLLGFRFIVMFTNWIIARTSYVFEITIELRGNIFGTRSFVVSMILMLFQLLVAFLLEIIYTTNFEENQNYIISDATYSRLFTSSLLILISEIILGVTLFVELRDLQSINFVRSIITGASYLSLLLNPSKYFLQWFIILFYTSGMIFYIYPREQDQQQKKMEVAATVLFLRSLFLPI